MNREFQIIAVKHAIKWFSIAHLRVEREVSEVNSTRATEDCRLNPQHGPITGHYSQCIVQFFHSGVDAITTKCIFINRNLENPGRKVDLSQIVLLAYEIDDNKS